MTPHGIRHNIEINGLHWRLFNEVVVVALLKDDGIMCRGLVVATSEWTNSRSLMSNEVLFQRHKGKDHFENSKNFFEKCPNYENWLNLNNPILSAAM